ncbi:hypothetical protein BD413DRAFT_130122 [Trametes elegans]|nr:hypothetical protein BD413DRAFT_130122 [Trametes elegans]
MSSTGRNSRSKISRRIPETPPIASRASAALSQCLAIDRMAETRAAHERRPQPQCRRLARAYTRHSYGMTSLRMSPSRWPPPPREPPRTRVCRGPRVKGPRGTTKRRGSDARSCKRPPGPRFRVSRAHIHRRTILRRRRARSLGFESDGARTCPIKRALRLCVKCA